MQEQPVEPKCTCINHIFFFTLFIAVSIDTPLLQARYLLFSDNAFVTAGKN